MGTHVSTHVCMYMGTHVSMFVDMHVSMFGCISSLVYVWVDSTRVRICSTTLPKVGSTYIGMRMYVWSYVCMHTCIVRSHESTRVCVRIALQVSRDTDLRKKMRCTDAHTLIHNTRMPSTFYVVMTAFLPIDQSVTFVPVSHLSQCHICLSVTFVSVSHLFQ